MGRSGLRVLYSFPHKIGAGGICYSAWEHAKGMADIGIAVTVFSGAVQKPLPARLNVATTLAWGRVRLPYKLLGADRALSLHDYLTARHLLTSGRRYDVVHVWPLAARRTMSVASEIGIPTVLERPNAHTGYAYEAVAREARRIGVSLEGGYDYSPARIRRIIAKEEEEFRAAYRIACASEFARASFVAMGYDPKKLMRHFRGVDERRFFPLGRRDGKGERPFTMLFVGTGAVGKGLHLALEAWIRSGASAEGQFVIAGRLLPNYAATLLPMLNHASVRVLGPRNDVAALMREADILVLPSIAEGFGKVCTEAMASGCVPVVSDSCTDICRHMENALVHPAGDVQALERHIACLCDDHDLLARLRRQGILGIQSMTWRAASVRLAALYQEVVQSYRLDRPAGRGFDLSATT